jgi:hypothetical protein
VLPTFRRWCGSWPRHPPATQKEEVVVVLGGHKFLGAYFYNVNADTFNPNNNNNNGAGGGSLGGTITGTTVASDYDLVCEAVRVGRRQLGAGVHLPGRRQRCGWVVLLAAAGRVRGGTAHLHQRDNDERGDDDGDYCIQEYDYWLFDAYTSQYSALLYCQGCIEGGSDGNTTATPGACAAVDDWCLALLYGATALSSGPTSCQIGFASTSFTPSRLPYVDCTVCQAAAGSDGAYGATAPNCQLTESTAQCFSAPYFSSPSPQLRAQAQQSSNSRSTGGGVSSIGAIVGSVVGVVLFFGIGFGGYYLIRKYLPDEEDEDNNSTSKPNGTTAANGTTANANVSP